MSAAGSPPLDARLRALGWTGHWAAVAAGAGAPPGTVPARIVRHDGVAVVVAGADGTSTRPLRPALPPLAVGDWVLVDAESVVTLLPRTSLLQRRDPTRGGAQVMAANVDCVGIVGGLDRPVKPGRIQRFVVQVRAAGAVPLVVLTKADLVDASAIAAARAAVARATPGVTTIVASVHTAGGLDAVRAAVADRTVAFVGESGAGKSTLVNALAGREIAATRAVRRGDAKGRHTTTARALHVIGADSGPGCRIVDTPGLREIGIYTDVGVVDDVFDDVVVHVDDCRFLDCTHTNEPGCAVLAAVAAGTLDPERLAAWRHLRGEAAEGRGP